MKGLKMEIVTISSPISIGFWFTVGAMLAGFVITAICVIAAAALKLLFG